MENKFTEALDNQANFCKVLEDNAIVSKNLKIQRLEEQIQLMRNEKSFLENEIK